MRLIPFCVLFLASSLMCQPLFAAKIYQWTDHKGVRHFSDRIPTASKHGQITQFDKPELKTTQFEGGKAIPLQKQAKRKKKTVRSTTRSKCEKLKLEISNILNKLKVKLKADKFDQLNAKLSALRWKKITAC